MKNMSSFCLCHDCIYLFIYFSAGELKMVGEGGERRICSCQALLLGTTWGPFPGKIEVATGGSDKVGLLIYYGGEFKR